MYKRQPGRLASVANKLKSAGINIKAFTIAESGDFGIIRMVVDKSEYAYNVLHASGFTVSETTVLGIEMRDLPGSMSHIAEAVSYTHLVLFLFSKSKHLSWLFNYLHIYSLAVINNSFSE